ncbi:MAG: YdeI/OmpD-associated family protein [Bacteroidota bacterium]
MKEDKLITNKEYLLKKFPGKGGWTYAVIPEVHPNKKTPFGWVKVKGFIDNYELQHYKLMPMGDGSLFLPVKAAIRKKIKKQEGDTVWVKLFFDESTLKIPDEIISCFENEPPEIRQTFMNFTDNERKVYLDWIYAAKKEATKVDRIVTMLERLAKKLKFYD